MSLKTSLRLGVLVLCFFGCGSVSGAAISETNASGPYNSIFLEGGVGQIHALAPSWDAHQANKTWSISGWVNPVRQQRGEVIVAAVGDTATPAWRGLLLTDGRPTLRLGPDVSVQASAALPAGQWSAVVATFDGTSARLYVDGVEVVRRDAVGIAVVPTLTLAPNSAGREHFGGSLADFLLEARAPSAQEASERNAQRPNFSLTTFNHVGVAWPFQERAWRGLQEPQDPWTLPHAHSAPSAPVAETADPASLHVVAAGPRSWNVAGWRMSAADQLGDGGERLSRAGYADQHWYDAVVPGTVLTTLIARGVYPDPDYGLNNMAIPESLARRDFWYRSEFRAPAGQAGGHYTLLFKGINYAAEVWLNGTRLGNIKGAFTRGVFDVSGKLRPGQTNALAVHIWPPPHPGIPHEESIAAGPGENGGNLALDGPTFIASEGWDWIPGIRDRNMGIWQAVELQESGELRLLDPQVITTLPLPRIDAADVSITVAIDNRAASAVSATVNAQFEGVSIAKNVRLAPGRNDVRLLPAEFPALHLKNPRLWWPNGYGPANLYTLRLKVSQRGAQPEPYSDSQSLRFGVRQLTYELSLFDQAGRLRRVEVDPTGGTARGEQLVDGRHEAIKRTPNGWAASLTLAGESSPAVHDIPTESLSPYLAIRVNGVPIAARGGSWGTDDSRKRVSRAHLEPFFELHRSAHLNIIRNWLGQNTEDVFYDLADEYGLLVLNDFWVSTQDFQLEPQDPQLFLANAHDVISRYRNHPSIAVWFGRNEGVPPPILNEGLAALVATLDGTRYYTGSSNTVNLQGSGPYNYRPPEKYFTELAQGFSVEVGTPSLASLEAIKAMVPEADRWPISDTLAYHDWHFGGNGDVASFMAALAEQYGEAGSLEDFERKAQLMNYVTYRAIFEGFQSQLWTRNSGRLLWMTHPAWPSNHWQIYSSDYDTAAAYYGVKKACEPLHVQLDLPDYRLAVVNTTRETRAGLFLRARVITLDNRVLSDVSQPVNAAANAVTNLAPLDLGGALASEGLVLVKLTLSDSGGALLSDNVYWQSRDAAGQRRLNDLAPQSLTFHATAKPNGPETLVDVLLGNSGHVPALAARITMLDAKGERVLPVEYSDNYVTLLPGESVHLTVRCPQSSRRCERVRLRGWNVGSQESIIENPVLVH